MQVKWNKKALAQLGAAIDYGRSEFDTRTAERLYNRIMSYEPLLAANPKIGMEEPLLAGRQRVYRSIVVHKLFKLVYYTDEVMQTLHIAALWDTRREPGALK